MGLYVSRFGPVYMEGRKLTLTIGLRCWKLGLMVKETVSDDVSVGMRVRGGG